VTGNAKLADSELVILFSMPYVLVSGNLLRLSCVHCNFASDWFSVA